MNRLAGQKSAYLSTAAHQPVHWRPWSAEAFTEAEASGKPVLLDIGAVWCHWCHVMDRESYENEATARIINERYIAVKVDRDERPDVDARYQRHVSALSGQGGWPLTAILTPDGRPFFGGTYFPPEDRQGRPGFPSILEKVADFFHENRDKIDDVTDRLKEALSAPRAAKGEGVDADEGIHKAVSSILRHSDSTHGGFGGAPKFPHCSALRLLLSQGARGDDIARETALSSLAAMAKGGVYDHLAGGFHRYAVDERWHVPHFEKMLYDNAELLPLYAGAFALTGESLFADTAHGTVRFVREWLTDPVRGGFYASQDADINLDDDGDHFTWTTEEAVGVLEKDEFEAIRRHFDLRHDGDMSHDQRRCVLQFAADAATVAGEMGIGEKRAAALIASGRKAMYEARLARPVPYVDKTIYANWNGMMIAGLARSAGWLDDPSLLKDARKAFIRIVSDNDTFHHGLARRTGDATSPPGGLDDYAWLALAGVELYTATGEARFVKQAQALAAHLIDRFRDPDGGYYDIDATGADPVVAALPAGPPMQDAPSTSAMATALLVMERLAVITGDPRYGAEVVAGLKRCGAETVNEAIFYAGMAEVVDVRREEAHVTFVGTLDATRPLADAVRKGFYPNITLSFIAPDDERGFPPTQETEAMIASFPAAEGEGLAFVCRGGACQAPVGDAESLIALLA